MEFYTLMMVDAIWRSNFHFDVIPRFFRTPE